MAGNADLECIKKQCSEDYTDGEVTQEQIVFASYSQHCSIAIDTFKAKPEVHFRWLVLTSEAAMLDPHTAAELSIDDIAKMCDELIDAHEEYMKEYI